MHYANSRNLHFGEVTVKPTLVVDQSARGETMRGRDRCDEIVRLIDETLGNTPAAAPRRPATSRPSAGAGLSPSLRSPSRTRPPAETSDRRDLLAAVGDFLAGTSVDTSPSVA
jgi:hypothetical protein